MEARVCCDSINWEIIDSTRWDFVCNYARGLTYDMLGMMIFDLDKSNVMRDIRYLEPAVKQSI